MAPESGGGTGSSSHRRQFQYVENLAEELNLSAGQIVRAWVADPLPDEPRKIFISLRGRKTVARTSLDVDRGDELVVQVRSTSSPIELKLYRPDSAPRDLSDEDLERFLQNQDFTASEGLVEVARFLLDEHLSMKTETIEKAQSVWDAVHDDNGDIRTDRARALKFLLERDLPVEAGTLSQLANIPETGLREADWTVLDSGITDERPLLERDFSKLVQQVGVDLVRQIGKWPATASRTLHARLLRTVTNAENSNSASDDPIVPNPQSLLAQILGLALAGVSSPTSWVVVPFSEGGHARLLTIGFKESGEEGETRWNVEARSELTNMGTIGLSLTVTNVSVAVCLRIESESGAELVRERAESWTKSMKSDDLDVKVTVKHETPNPLEPFASDPGRFADGSPGKVDVTA